MTFEIIKRMNTRSTSYTRRSVVDAITSLGLQFTEVKLVITVEVPANRRAELEYRLRLIDRGIAYRITL